MMKTTRLFPLFVALILLSGCTASLPIRQDSSLTLPPPDLGFEAPLGDAAEGTARTVLLCLPSARTGLLEYFPEKVLLSGNRHPAEYTLRRLFSYTGTTQADPLTMSSQLGLNPGSAVEISGDTATVNLAPSALNLSNAERYLVSRAIANTLTQWGDIRYVNILINNRLLGLDTASSIPLTSLGKTADGDIAALWDQVSQAPANPEAAYTGMATIYYPVSAGRGIAAQSRLITSNSRSLSDLALALLEALSAPGDRPPNTPQVPDLATLLTRPPAVDEGTGGTGRVIHLAFHEGMNEALIAAGITRSVMMAALTCTLTTFLPYTAGITVTIGAEQVGALVPAGLYDGAGEQIHFENNIMQRAQFSRFLLDHCTLYFAHEGGLSATRRAIPHYQMHNPRYLLNQLMEGPKSTDSVPGLAAVLPEALKDADLLGIAIQNETALLHFSGQLREASATYDPQQELQMVYAMVDTLSQLPAIRQACFFIEGSQEGHFVSEIDLAGVFLRNEGIIR